jgi:hypothetical protein
VGLLTIGAFTRMSQLSPKAFSGSRSRPEEVVVAVISCV